MCCRGSKSITGDPMATFVRSFRGPRRPRPVTAESNLGSKPGQNFAAATIQPQHTSLPTLNLIVVITRKNVIHSCKGSCSACIFWRPRYVFPKCEKWSSQRILDTSCILAWLIEQGYEVYAFMADVGQVEVSISLGLTGLIR